MKFGKMQSVEGVDFTLPPVPDETRLFVQSLPPLSHKPTVYIGGTGWSMKEWVGHVYPPKTKSTDYLKYYSKQFNTIELNTTHYRIPDENLINKWCSQSESDFRFCPKLPQVISHRAGFGGSSGVLLQFCEVIQKLEEKLGCCFIQLPPYFGYDRLAKLEYFLEIFPKHIPLAVELRHKSWFENSFQQKAVFDLLQKYKTGAVITDVAGRRDVCHQRVTSQIAMIRFVGNNLVHSDYMRIDQWVVRMKTWFEMGLQEVYFFTHEPDNLKAPELALYLANQLKERADVICRGPTLPYEEEGQQISLF